MSTKQLLVFLADDDADDRQFFKEALEGLAFHAQVSSFENGVELMANLLDTQSVLPDFIFLDLNMPMMTGEECLNDIKNEPSLSHLPIIIYSTSFSEVEAKRLHQKGANRYIQKPTSFALLKTCLERCLVSLSDDLRNEPSDSAFLVS
ncbi:MAG: response regulator [Maribacter sp.]